MHLLLFAGVAAAITLVIVTPRTPEAPPQSEEERQRRAYGDDFGM